MASGKIVVPDEMFIAAVEAVESEPGISYRRAIICAALEAALRWLSENPIVPTQQQVQDLWQHVCKTSPGSYTDGLVEWQRRMFRAPEPEVPEAVEDLMFSARPRELTWVEVHTGHDADVIEAYRRGQKAGK